MWSTGCQRRLASRPNRACSCLPVDHMEKTDRIVFLEKSIMRHEAFSCLTLQAASSMSMVDIFKPFFSQKTIKDFALFTQHIEQPLNIC
jgi:hypothetical protein